MAAETGERLVLPAALVVLGWLVFLVAGAQLLYSLFINLPFRSTYITKGVGDRLVTTGLYALVRHPGVYGLAALMFGAAIVSGSSLLIVAVPIWMVVDVVVVYVQDHCFFDAMYPDYPSYRLDTPLLIPNWRSLVAFITNFSLTNLTSRRPDMSQLAKLFAAEKYDEVWRRCCGFLDLSREDFMRIQKRLLLEQLSLFSRCELGNHLAGGPVPDNLEEFRATVPLTNYEDYAPYLLKRRMDVLPKKPLLWQYTSGKTGEYTYRWVPVTSRMVDELEPYIFALMLLSCAHHRGDVRLHSGDRVFYGMAPPPYATGSMARAFPHELFRMLPELEQAERMGFEDRLKQGFDQALKDGLDLNFSMSRLARAMVRARLAHRAILPRDLWNVKGLITYGIDGEVFREKIKEMWGTYSLDFHGCTEALIVAMQAWDHSGMTFVPSLQFYEFIPEKDALRSRQDHDFKPRTLLLDEVVPGNYELVITSFHGGPFLRYRLGHLVKIHSLSNERLDINIPQMSFVARIDDQIDIAGFTRLGEKVIWQAIENTGLAYEDWVARKEVDNRPILHLFVELKGADRHLQPEKVAALIHGELKKLDQPYAELESFADIHPLRVTMLPEGAFRTFRLRQIAAGAGQQHLKPAHINSDRSEIEFLVSTAAVVKARTSGGIEV
jgi:hypothetical protein